MDRSSLGGMRREIVEERGWKKDGELDRTTNPIIHRPLFLYDTRIPGLSERFGNFNAKLS